MSVCVRLVRHGEPAEAIGVDPGLSARGHDQAALLARLSPALLVSSPLRRARETAAPIEAAWSVAARVDSTYRELPSGHVDSGDRRAWLRVALAGTFAELGDEQRAWRDAIVAAVRSCREDTVITTHAVVINAVTGFSQGDDAVLAWLPAHASVTEMRVDVDGTLTLVARGERSPGGLVV